MLDRTALILSGFAQSSWIESISESILSFTSIAIATFMPDDAMVDRVCRSLAAAAENTATRALLFNSSEVAINTVITERVIRRAIPLLFPVKRTVIKDLKVTMDSTEHLDQIFKLEFD